MKKNIIISVLAIIAVLIISVAAPLLLSHEAKNERYHQHISAKLRPEDEVDDGTFNSHLPVIKIDTNNVEIPGKPVFDPLNPTHTLKDENGHTLYSTTEDGSKTLHVSISVFDSTEHVNRLTDTPEIISEAEIRVRGASSRYHDKSNYYLKLVTSGGENNKQALLGMDAHHEWALHGPFLDKTLMRNYMWYNISAEIMGYAPNVRFCEVFIDDEYKGLYVLTETLTSADNNARLNLTVNAKKNKFSGYLLRVDRGSGDPLKDINTYSIYTRKLYNPINIEFPGSENLTESISEQIRQDFSTFEKSMYSFDYDNDKDGYKDFIDVKSFADYLIINEFTCNYDAGWLSTYICKGTDNKYRMVVWDFNNCCDNYKHSMVSEQHFEFQACPYFVMLLKDEDFGQYVIERYNYLRKNYLNSDYLDQYINDVIDYLGPAIDRNFEVWGYTFEDTSMLAPEERNPASFDEAVSDYNLYLKERANWMDKNIYALLQYSNESKVKKYNENAN